MLRKLLPLLLALIGLGGGVGAGLALRPAPVPAPESQATTDAHGANETSQITAGSHDEPPASTEFVKLNNQFIVPILRDGQVASLVILSLSLEVRLGGSEAVYRAEPKLRDAFLQVLFDHANAGGFEGTFTGSANMELLRESLTETARMILGGEVVGVLVADLVRQDS